MEILHHYLVEQTAVADRETVAYRGSKQAGNHTFGQCMQTGIMAEKMLYTQSTLHNQAMKPAVHGLSTSLCLSSFCFAYTYIALM